MTDESPDTTSDQPADIPPLFRMGFEYGFRLAIDQAALPHESLAAKYQAAGFYSDALYQLNCARRIRKLEP